MEGRFAVRSWSLARKVNVLMARNVYDKTARLMGTRAPNRAAVHGTRPPVTRTINIDEVEAEIEKMKQEKQQKIEEIEKKLDSKFKNIPKASDS